MRLSRVCLFVLVMFACLPWNLSSAQGGRGQERRSPAIKNLEAISCRLYLNAIAGPLGRLGAYFSPNAATSEEVISGLDSYFAGRLSANTLDSKVKIRKEVGMRSGALVQFLEEGGSELRSSSVQKAANLLFRDWSDDIGSFLNDFPEVLQVFEDKKPFLLNDSLDRRQKTFALSHAENARDEQYLRRLFRSGAGPGSGSRSARWARPSVQLWSNYPLLIPLGTYKLKNANFEDLERLVPPGLRLMLTVPVTPDALKIYRSDLDEENGATVVSLKFYAGEKNIYTFFMFKTDQAEDSKESFAMVEWDVYGDIVDSIPLGDQLLVIDSSKLELNFGTATWRLINVD